MLHIEIPRNTAYNPMIYITFFIVILISKRGVREAERGGKRERTIRAHNDTKNDTKNEKRHAPSASTTQHNPAMRKEACSQHTTARERRKKRYTPQHTPPHG